MSPTSPRGWPPARPRAAREHVPRPPTPRTAACAAPPPHGPRMVPARSHHPASTRRPPLAKHTLIHSVHKPSNSNLGRPPKDDGHKCDLCSQAGCRSAFKRKGVSGWPADRACHSSSQGHEFKLHVGHLRKTAGEGGGNCDTNTTVRNTPTTERQACVARLCDELVEPEGLEEGLGPGNGELVSVFWRQTFHPGRWRELHGTRGSGLYCVSPSSTAVHAIGPLAGSSGGAWVSGF